MENTKPNTPSGIDTSNVITNTLVAPSKPEKALIITTHIITNTVSDKPKPIHENTEVFLLTGGGVCIANNYRLSINKITKLTINSQVYILNQVGGKHES